VQERQRCGLAKNPTLGVATHKQEGSYNLEFFLEEGGACVPQLAPEYWNLHWRVSPLIVWLRNQWTYIQGTKMAVGN